MGDEKYGEVYQLHDIDDNDIYPQTVMTAVYDVESGRNVKQIIDDLEAGIVPQATDEQIELLFNQ